MFDILNEMAALEHRQREMVEALGKQGIRPTKFTLTAAYMREGLVLFLSKMFVYGVMEDGQMVVLYRHDGDLPWQPEDFADLLDDAFKRLAEMRRMAFVLMLQEAARR